MDVFFSADDRQEYLDLQEGRLAEGKEKEMKYTGRGNSTARWS